MKGQGNIIVKQHLENFKKPTNKITLTTMYFILIRLKSKERHRCKQINILALIISTTKVGQLFQPYCKHIIQAN